jgi:hypothetical protein
MMEVKLPFRVQCLNAKDKPNDIPTSKWVVEGEFYTVVKIAKLLIQGGMVGFKLEELNIDAYFPYQFFAANRFGIPVDQGFDVDAMLNKILEEAKEEVKELNEYYVE